MKKGLRIEILWLLLAFCVAAAAQTPVPSATPASEECALATQEPVQLDVSVRSGREGYLKNLTAKDFSVNVEDKLHPLDSFVLPAEPASVTVLFDVSNSMKGSRDAFNETAAAAEGFKEFLNGGHPENEYTLVTFGKTVNVLRAQSSDRSEVLQTLEDIRRLDLKDADTVLLDAVEEGFRQALRGRHARKVLFLVTDAFDNGSRTKFDKVLELSRRENVRFYLIKMLPPHNGTAMENFLAFRSIPVLSRQFVDLNIINNYAGSFPAPGSLLMNFNDLTAETGGRAFYPTDAKEAGEVFRDAAEEQKAQYRIGFCPLYPGKDAWHKIKIKLNLPPAELKRLGKLAIRAKQGYYGRKS